MPHYTPHAVYNLEETVAVGDNPFFTSAIEEAAMIHKSEPHQNEILDLFFQRISTHRKFLNETERFASIHLQISNFISS